MDIYQTIRCPLITEKGTLLREAYNQYLFEVDLSANKYQIKNAIQVLFNVHVKDVKTLRVRGKNKRVGRNIGRTSNWKKVYVTLTAGEKIDFFEGM